MAITWPETLVTEIAERRCIIFMGAGASMSSRSKTGQYPPGWKLFLQQAVRLVPKRVDKAYARQLIEEGRFLDAAEVIAECSDRAEFGGYVRNALDEPRYAPSEMHKIILELDPKIVITTNYDQIYDTYCRSGIAAGGYNIALYTDKNIVENIRSRIRLVIKAHGCVSHPQEIILSRSSYYRARRDYPCMPSS